MKARVWIIGSFVAIAVIIGLGILLGGCGKGVSDAPVTGTVVAKDYDPTEYKRTRDCRTRYTTGTQKGQCKIYGPYYDQVVEREDWDITVRDAAGDEHEIEVTRDEYNSVQVGDTWPR